ncbi:MAG: PAS domain-containing protein, partial [Kiritimatiellae bacterium]|nr:PAS domain-containing protein [Kiritimatiellia bacterium]
MARKISIYVLVVVLLANLCMSLLIGVSLLRSTVDYVDNEGCKVAQTGAHLFEYAIDASIRNGVFDEADYFVSEERGSPEEIPERIPYKLYLQRNLERNMESLCHSLPVYYVYGVNRAGEMLLHAESGFSLKDAVAPEGCEETRSHYGDTRITRWRADNGVEYYDYEEPVYVRNRPWGSFHAGIPVNYIGSQIHMEAVRLILYSLMVAALCAWLVYLAVKHWMSPLQALISDTQEMTMGNLDVMSPYGKNQDELGALARAFNGMAATIRISVQTLEAQVRERTAGLNTLIESSPVGLLVVNEKDGRVVRANQALGSLLNESVEAMRERTLDELFGQKEGCSALAQGDFLQVVKLSIPARQGDVSVVLARQVRIVMDGATCRLIILLDVTDQEKAWRAVEDSEHRYRQLITQLNTAIIVFDADLRVQMINQSAMRLLRFRPEVMGRHCDELDWGDMPCGNASPPNGGQISELVREVSRDGMMISNRLIERCAQERDDARRYWVLAGAVPLYDEHGESSQLVLSLNDVSELKQIQEEYRALSDKRRELESIIEHSVMSVLLIQLNPARLEYASANVKQYGFSPEDFGQSAGMLLRM